MKFASGLERTPSARAVHSADPPPPIGALPQTPGYLEPKEVDDLRIAGLRSVWRLRALRLNPAQIAIEVAGFIILDTYIEVMVVARLPSV